MKFVQIPIFFQNYALLSSLVLWFLRLTSAKLKFSFDEIDDMLNDMAVHQVPPVMDEEKKPNVEAPKMVEVALEVARFGQITPTFFTAEVILVLNWKDNRFLQGLNKGLQQRNVTMNVEELPTLRFSEERILNVWRPPIFFSNALDAKMQEVSIDNHMVLVEKGANVVYGTRTLLDISCQLNFRKMPFDHQYCNIEITMLGYDLDDLDLRWMEPVKVGDTAASVRDGSTQLHEFSILGIKPDSVVASTFKTKHNQRILVATIHFKREIGYYITQVYLPTVLLLLVNWMSFWVDMDQTAARVGLCITTILTMQTIHIGTGKMLPNVSYFKAIDIWLCVCQSYVCLGLAVFILNHKIIGTKREQKEAKYREIGKKIDKAMIILYPATFIIFWIVYWCVFSIHSS